MKRFNCDFGSRFRILKGGKISLVVSAILSSTTLVFAAPSGGVVTSGTADISQSGNTTNITQSTNKATINWQDFSIKSNETVNFNQPNVNSITLNRVVGNERSVIDGALNANGQVWILNSNGILFNKDSKINTAGILATTKNVSDADFNAGNYKFTGNSTAGVINMGTIEASDSGYVALLANTVQNNGTIKAYKGTVHLTGASEATINLNGNSIVSLTVNKGVLDALVENKGAVLADGGKIFLTTNAVDEILKGVVNNTGLIEANSLDDISGEVILFAHGGTANISGTIEAVGGFVETSGKELRVADGRVIKAKKWLIDPIDVTIVSGGSDAADSTSDYPSISATAIETALGIGNVVIEATNNITVNEAITVKNYTLTLNAIKDLNVNAKMTVSSGALDLRAFNDMNINETIDIQSPNISLNMIYGNKLNLAMNSDKTAFIGKVNLLQDTYLNINYDHYTIINTSTDLASLTTYNGTVRYVLGSDITSGMTNWTPIGAFAGKFDGLGHTVDGLTINATSSSSNQGLFSNIFHGSVSNLALTSVNVNGTGSNNDEGHGALAGSIGENASISNIILQGSVKGNKNSSSSKNFGGLAGYLYGGTINNVHANVDVEGYKNIGGLIGSNSTGTITNSYAEGKVEGNDYIGGLVGSSYDANIVNSYATGEVIGNTQVGGLAGGFMKWTLGYVTMEKSYATGKVTGTEQIGGLIGYTNSANIANVFATGDVTNTLAASKKTGALIGMSVEGSVKNSYASGQVTVGADTTAHLGGLIGANDDDFTDVEYSFYNKTLNVGKSDEATSGKTTAELKSLATYSTWGITEDSTLTDMYPRLAASGWVINPAAGTPTNGGSTGGGSTPTPVPNPEPTPTKQDTKIEKVITSIVNNSTTNVNVPKDILLPKVNLGQNAPILPMTPTVQASPVMQNLAQKLGVNQGEELSLVSTTLEGQATQKITLGELKELSEGSNNPNERRNTPIETRVALGDNSIVELVNGGVSLPEGVDQEFYVTKNKKNKK